MKKVIVVILFSLLIGLLAPSSALASTPVKVPEVCLYRVGGEGPFFTATHMFLTILGNGQALTSGYTYYWYGEPYPDPSFFVQGRLWKEPEEENPWRWELFHTNPEFWVGCNDGTLGLRWWKYEVSSAKPFSGPFQGTRSIYCGDTKENQSFIDGVIEKGQCELPERDF